MAAFDRAIDLGADGLELDVRLSRDGCPVVHHDVLLARTTGAIGSVGDHTAEELARMDAGFHFDPRGGYPFRGQNVGVPALREVLTRYPGVPMIVEMKGESPELAHAALEAVRKADALDRICFGAFSLATLAVLRASEPAAATGAASAEIRSILLRARLGWWAGPISFRVCQAPLRFRRRRILSGRTVRWLHRRDIPVHVWTVNEPNDVQRVLAWGVDAIITDVPDVVCRIRAGG